MGAVEPLQLVSEYVARLEGASHPLRADVRARWNRYVEPTFRQWSQPVHDGLDRQFDLSGAFRNDGDARAGVLPSRRRGAGKAEQDNREQ